MHMEVDQATISPDVEIDNQVAQIRQVETATSCKEQALSLLQWAIDHHMVDALVNSEHVNAQATPPSDGTLFQPNSNTVSALRQKIVAGVLFNDEEQSITLLTRKKIGIRQLEKLPHLAGAYSLKYLHIGNSFSGGPAVPSDNNGYYEKNGFYCCGSSIHPVKYPGAGTFGAILMNNQGQIFGLSNNHVSGLCNYADDGEKIIAPGHVDITPRTRDPFTIGVHTRALPMIHGLPPNVDVDSNSDAAIFELRNPNQVTSFQGIWYDTPGIVMEPLGNMVVQKVGRTTGLTTGRIIGTSPNPIAVGYQLLAAGGNATAYFNNVFIAIGENGNPFSLPGDSGSLVTTVLPSMERVAIGIVFAGTQFGHSYILPIRPILEALGMNLVTGHNT